MHCVFITPGCWLTSQPPAPRGTARGKFLVASASAFSKMFVFLGSLFFPPTIFCRLPALGILDSLERTKQSTAACMADVDVAA